MNLFLDSSALVKRYVEERGTPAVLELMRRADLCLASRLAWLEITSAVARASRYGTLSDPRSVLSAVDDDFCVLVGIVEVTPAVISDARRLTLKHPLRAADAVHLSSVLMSRSLHGTDVRFVCSDRKLNDAAASEGLNVVDPQEVRAE